MGLYTYSEKLCCQQTNLLQLINFVDVHNYPEFFFKWLYSWGLLNLANSNHFYCTSMYFLISTPIEIDHIDED